MQLTPELIDAWKWELAVQVQKSQAGGTELGRKKADFLEGVYTALTCLERAMSGERSPHPINEFKNDFADK